MKWKLISTTLLTFAFAAMLPLSSVTALASGDKDPPKKLPKMNCTYDSSGAAIGCTVEKDKDKKKDKN